MVIKGLFYFHPVISKFKYHILLHTIILMWGFTGILGKLIQMNPVNLVWYRILVAFVALSAAMLFLRKSFRLDSFSQLAKIMLVGIAVALHWVTFYTAISLSTASLGILCLSTTTLHVSWLEPIITKRKFSLVEFSLGIVVIYGVYFISSDSSLDNNYEALGYGLISAFMGAIFAVFNSKFAQTVSPSKITFYELISGGIFLSGVLFFQGKINASLFTMSQSDFWWLMFLGVLCTSFAFLATIKVMKKLGAFTVSLSINLEPVYTIMLAIFILNENELLGYQFYISSFIIVSVVILNALIKWFSKKRESLHL